MKSIRGIVIGNSHIVAIYNAYVRYEKKAKLNFSFISRDVAAQEEIDTDMGELLREAIRKHRPEVIISCIGGNVHNIFGLVDHPSRFDLVIPEYPQLGLDEHRQLIPNTAIANLFESMIRDAPSTFEELRHGHDIPVIHLESPPTNPSEEHILDYPGVFEDKFKELGVTPAVIRFKLWRLHSSVVRRICAEYGITFLAVPSGTQDNDGMMVEQAWNPDPVHANEWYGRQVLNQLAEFLPAFLNQS